jgi:hypothetical protein
MAVGILLIRARPVLAVALVASAAFLSTSDAAPVCDTTWTAVGDGEWGTGANWSNGVPDGGKRACILAAGTYNVTLRGTQNAMGLTLGGASGVQTLSLTGASATGIGRLNLFDQGNGSEGIGENGVLRLESTDSGTHAQL